MEPAREDSWTTQPLPRQTAVLDYKEEFSSEELEKIKLGLIPEEMEDKWFIYFDQGTLHLHRSWTGACIYEVEFEASERKHVVRRALTNRNQDQYGSTDDAYDSALLHFLISNLLLGRRLPFPTPEASPEGGLTGILQHHISGTGYLESPVDTNVGRGVAKRRPWWRFWSRSRRT